MSYYPLMVDLENRKTVVVGGGRVAERKIATLLEYGAIIDVISPQLTPLLEHYVHEGQIQYIAKDFQTDFLNNVFLVIAATDDPKVNHNVSICAQEHGILVNVVDQPHECTFIVPSIVKRGDLLIAVSTSGKSPALAKKIRKILEKHFGEEYGHFLLVMGTIRSEILNKGFSGEKRKRIFYELVNSPLLQYLAHGKLLEAAECVNKILGSRLTHKDLMKDRKG